MSKTSTVVSTVSPYLYAGAIRVGVTRGVTGAKLAITRLVPEAHREAVRVFLDSEVGDGLLRAALGGALFTRDLPGAVAPLQSDMRQELLISAAADGFDALIAALVAGGEMVHARLAPSDAEGGEESGQ